MKNTAKIFEIFISLLGFIDYIPRAFLKLVLGSKRIHRLQIYQKHHLSFLTLISKRLDVKKLWILPYGKYLTHIEWYEKGILPDGDEPEVLQYCNLEKGDVAFDIGSHHGYYTLIFSRKVGDGGFVVSVEPDVNNLKFVQANVSFNNLKNVTIIPFALYDKHGTIRIFRGPRSVQSSISHELKSGGEIVKTITLDSLLSKFNRIKYVKIDVEGAELKILKSSKLLSRVDRLIIEIHSRNNMEKLIKLLSDKDFICKKIISSRPFLIAAQKNISICQENITRKGNPIIIFRDRRKRRNRANANAELLLFTH